MIQAHHVPDVEPLVTSVLEDPRELLALEEEWSHLHAASARATPFQSPAWLVPWTRAFVHGPVRVICVRERSRGSLVGLLPLFRHDVDGERRLRLLGAGLSDYLDGVFARDPDLEDVAVSAAIRGLVGSSPDWDVCALEQLGTHAALREAPLLPAFGGTARLSVETRQGTPGSVPCPRLVFPPSCTIDDVVPPRQLARLRKYRRRAQREGLLVLDVVTSERESRLAFRTFLELHEARWRASSPRSEPGATATSVDAFARPEVRAFHEQVVPSLARASALRLYVLRLGSRPIASLYALADATTLYCYGQGFDPELAPFSPGLLVIGAAIEDALEVGLRTVDFLRGREPYKLGWAPEPHATVERRIAPVRRTAGSSGPPALLGS